MRSAVRVDKGTFQNIPYVCSNLGIKTPTFMSLSVSSFTVEAINVMIHDKSSKYFPVQIQVTPVVLDPAPVPF